MGFFMYCSSKEVYVFPDLIYSKLKFDDSLYLS